MNIPSFTKKKKRKRKTRIQKILLFLKRASTSLNLMIFLALCYLPDPTFFPTTITTDTTSLPPPPPQRPPLFTTSPPPPQQPALLTTSPSPPQPPPLFTTSPSPQSPQDRDSPDQSIFTSDLATILSHLGFIELATAAPTLFSKPAVAAAWSGPYTLFAPSDSSVLTCVSCYVPSILREHMVSGLFTAEYLRKLSFGTKIETFSPGRCITVTSSTTVQKDLTVYKIFIGGVEITHLDLFSNGMIIIHGLQGYISHLSPFSCDVERMTSPLPFPFQYDIHIHNQQVHRQLPLQQFHLALMRVMLRDAIQRLSNTGFSVLSLALKLKYAELVPLNNVTIFALDDVSIFSGSYSYINSVRLHIVPNQLLTVADLESLPVGTTLATLDTEQTLVVTTEGGALKKQMMMINYVSLKVADMIRNLNVIVHSLYLPFPHVYPMAAATTDPTLGRENHTSPLTVPMPGIDETCDRSLDDEGKCGMNQVNHVTSEVKQHYVPEIEDHHGL